LGGHQLRWNILSLLVVAVVALTAVAVAALVDTELQLD
jgi:hypothetical protein